MPCRCRLPRSRCFSGRPASPAPLSAGTAVGPRRCAPAFYAGFLGFCLGEARAHATTYLYYSMLVGTVCIPFPSPYWLLPVPLCMAVLVWQGGGSASPVLLLTATVAALSGAYLHHRRGKAFFLSRLRLERLSERDELTGLYNRRGLGKQAEQLWKACREMAAPHMS